MPPITPRIARLARPVGQFTLRDTRPGGWSPTRAPGQELVNIVSVSFDDGVSPSTVGRIAKRIARHDPDVFSVSWSRDAIDIVTVTPAGVTWSPRAVDEALLDFGAVDADVDVDGDDPFGWQFALRTAEADARHVLTALAGMHGRRTLHQCSPKSDWCVCDAVGCLGGNTPTAWAGQIGHLPGQLQDPATDTVSLRGARPMEVSA